MTVAELVEYFRLNPGTLALAQRALDHWKVWDARPKVYDWDKIYVGFRYHEVGANPWEIQTLVRAGVFAIKDRTNSGTQYTVADPEALAAALTAQEGLDPLAEGELSIPEDIFSPIIGYEPAKELFRRALEAPRPVHLLMLGPAASAKTMFLMEIQRLPGAEYHLGSSTTRAGLATVLLERRPRFLTIDEIDKMATADQDVLLSLCETGIVKETKWGRFRQAQLNTRVFAAANRVHLVRPEVLSRFGILEFSPYEESEFVEVVINVLTRREDVPNEVAVFLAEELWAQASREAASAIADPREAIRLARLMRTPTVEEARAVLAMMKQYRS